MKKLLIVMLVLAVASVANATLSITAPATVDLGATATVTVSSDTAADSYIAYVDFTGGVPLSNAQILAAAGPNAKCTLSPYGYAGYYEIAALDYTPPSDILAGAHFTFDLISTGADLSTTYTVRLLDEDWATEIGSVGIEVVPEPMTIALLGLGGLLLRRRK